MRQYAVILIAVVVLIAGYVARRQLTGPAPTPAAIEAVQAEALRAAEGLDAALKGGEREPEALAGKCAEVERSCQALAATPGAGSCGALRGQAEALQRAARHATIGESTVADVATSVAALRMSLQPVR